MTARELIEDSDVHEVLKSARTIAVLGAHPDAARPSHYVPAYLQENGYCVLPVNPGHVGKRLWGELTVAALTEIERDGGVDIVDIFRRAEALPGHLDEILGMKPLPKVVWFQEGIRNDEVARKLIAAGISVVQDRCAKREHMALS